MFPRRALLGIDRHGGRDASIPLGPRPSVSRMPFGEPLTWSRGSEALEWIRIHRTYVPTGTEVRGVYLISLEGKASDLQSEGSIALTMAIKTAARIQNRPSAVPSWAGSPRPPPLERRKTRRRRPVGPKWLITELPAAAEPHRSD
jgi:hypothetical protein